MGGHRALGAQCALIIAEELGVTQGNVERLARGTDHPEIDRMLGSEGSYSEMLGLDAQWAVRAIKAEGNYARRTPGATLSNRSGDLRPLPRNVVPVFDNLVAVVPM